MSDKSKGDDSSTDAQQSRIPWWRRLVNYPKRRFHERRTQKKNESAQDRFSRRTATATVWMAIFTGVIVLLGVAQYFIFTDQLNEMRTSGTQTDKLVAAYEKIAGATAKSVTASNNLVTATTDAVKASQRLAVAAEKANSESARLVGAVGEGNIQTGRLAEAANTNNEESRQLANNVAAANEISHKALLVSQRPFMFPTGIDLVKITADSFPFGTFGITTPNIPHDKPIFWLANVKWENSGNTPTSDLVIKTYCLLSAERLTEPYNIMKTKTFIGDKDGGGHTKDYAQIIYATEQHPLFGPKQSDNGGVCGINPVAILIKSVVPQMSYHNYIFGNATYRDLIESKTTYRTEFCYELLLTGNPNADWVNTPGQPAKVPELKGTPIRCQQHNCADGECERQEREAKKVERQKK